MKNSNLILLLFFASFTINSYSQEKNSILEIILNKVEEKIQQKNQVEKPVSKEKLPVKTSSSDKTVYRKNESNNYEIVIPVAFHVVSDSIPDSSIDISEFKEAIEYLNKGFNNVDKKVINPAYPYI